VGLPGLAGFIGEFMILFGTFGSETLGGARVMAILAATGVVLGAIYMLWMYQRVFFGKLANEKNRGLSDLSGREVAVLLPIVIFMFWLGVRPGLILDKVEASIAAVLAPISGEMLEAESESPHHVRHVEPAAGPGPAAFIVRDTESE
jgi:NADH-quinone oxidoreductase subunit M